MLLLSCDKISKAYGEHQVLTDVSLKIYAGDRIGLVGANGSGKSTLLKILAGMDTADQGQVKTYTRLSVLTQQDDGVPEATSSLYALPMEEKLASTLGVSPENLHARMSGGEKSRARFALQFDPTAGLLFADEPTSNMDMEATRVVQRELQSFKGALLLVSHDRSLLDELCTSILEVYNGRIRSFTGDYTSYVQQKEELYRRQSFEYDTYVKEKNRLEGRVIERMENIRSIKKAPQRMGNSEARLHKRGSTEIQKKLSQSVNTLRSRVDHLEVKERPDDPMTVKMFIHPVKNPVSQIAVRAKDLNLSFPGIKLLEHAHFEIPTRTRTVLMGRNGAGKTSLVEHLLKTAATPCDHEALVISPGVKVGYFRQDFSQLDLEKSILENVMAQSSRPEHEIRTLLARLLITREEVYKKVAVLSGGEKVKVSLARILASDANFLILDEPTNYLDVYSMEAMEQVLCDYTGTLLLISHDRKFIENVGQRLLIIEDNQIKTFEGTLKDYEEEKEKKQPSKGLHDQKAEPISPALQRMLMEMRLAELSSKIDGCRDEQLKKDLEQEYFDLCKSKDTLT